MLPHTSATAVKYTETLPTPGKPLLCIICAAYADRIPADRAKPLATIHQYLGQPDCITGWQCAHCCHAGNADVIAEAEGACTPDCQPQKALVTFRPQPALTWTIHHLPEAWQPPLLTRKQPNDPDWDKAPTADTDDIRRTVGRILTTDPNGRAPVKQVWRVITGELGAKVHQTILNRIITETYPDAVSIIKRSQGKRKTIWEGIRIVKNHQPEAVVHRPPDNG